MRTSRVSCYRSPCAGPQPITLERELVGMGPRGRSNQSLPLFLPSPPYSLFSILQPEGASRIQAGSHPSHGSCLRVERRSSHGPQDPVPSGPCQLLPHFISLFPATSSHAALCPSGMTHSLSLLASTSAVPPAYHTLLLAPICRSRVSHSVPFLHRFSHHLNSSC